MKQGEGQQINVVCREFTPHLILCTDMGWWNLGLTLCINIGSLVDSVGRGCVSEAEYLLGMQQVPVSIPSISSVQRTRQ